MTTRSTGQPAATSRGDGTGGRAGKGGGRTRGHSSDQGDAQVGNQGKGQRNGRNQNGDAVNDNIQGDVSKGCTYKKFLACNPKEYDGSHVVELLNPHTRAGHAAYTDRFHKLARLVPHLVTLEENGNTFNPVPRITANADGTFTSTISGPVTAEEKAQKKNDVKARSILLVALPNEHLLTFSQYKDAKNLFEAIQARFSAQSLLTLIFNNLQKIISQLAILGENISQEDLYIKFLRSLPVEWNTHVVVWRNKPDLETISFDDLYNNFKIVKQEVKRTVVSNSSSRSPNMAFLSSPSSTNEVDTTSNQVSAASTSVSTVSSPNNTANLSDATIYAFLANQPNGSQLVHEDLEEIHEDDLEEIDLKWQLALLSMRARRYFQRTCKKIFINGSDTVGYNKTKVECFNHHKMRHFAREYRSLRSQESRPRNQDNSKKTVIVEDTSSKAMMAIDGAGFD
uniref:Uncharacterized protein n=1 Tax=Tanacetum cinerariifolium TaxID=118510 RepID=A0A6L2NJS0_TANCI|nr:hypothetical protein [Tanacetum cinerariifolium]